MVGHVSSHNSDKRKLIMSGSSIFILNGNAELTEMKQAEFENEDRLQQLVANHPELLMGQSINPENPRRWLLVSREIGIQDHEDGVDRWRLDHLFLDQDGVPTLIEVKRVSDPRARREVVAQMLDYAANAVVTWKAQTLRTIFELQFEESDESPDDRVLALVGNEKTVDEFWESVKTNLAAQKIRMIFLADKITKELTTIVNFLNRQMDPAEVLAVEVQHYIDSANSFKTLVPVLIGSTAGSRIPRSSSSSLGDLISKEEYLQIVADQHSENRLATARKIISWAEQKPMRLSMRKGVRDTVVIPVYSYSKRDFYPISVKHHGKLVFQMRYLVKFQPFSDPVILLELEQKLRALAGFDIRGGMSGLPYVDMDKMQSDQQRESLLKVLDWIYVKLGSAFPENQGN